MYIVWSLQSKFLVLNASSLFTEDGKLFSDLTLIKVMTQSTDAV